MATIVSPRAEGCHRATNRLRTSDGGSGIMATPGPVRPADGGAIEIEFAAGARMRITGAVDAATLAAAVAALAGGRAR
jgi:hypothetical protein